MMRNYLRLLPAAAVGCLLVVGGCNEQTTVELHKPGQYKGAADPLLDVAGTEEQSARLKERVLAVQTDR